MNMTTPPRVVESEFKEKISYPVKLDFRKLAAADVATRARTFGSLIAAGWDKDGAASVAGLES